MLCCLFCVQLVVAQHFEPLSPDNLLREGQRMYADRNYVGCLDMLNRLEALAAPDAPADPEIEFLLLASTFRLGQLSDAKPLEAFIKAHPQSIHTNELYFMLADVLFSKKDAAAGAWLNKCDVNALSRADRRHHAFYKGVMQMEAGNYKAAERLFEPLKNEYIFHRDVEYYMTQIDFAKGNYAAVVEHLKPLVDRRSKSMSSADFSRLGLALYHEKNYSEAVKYLSNAVAGLPRSPLASSPMSAVQQNMYLAMGQSYMQLNDPDGALPAFERAARMNFDRKAKEAAMFNYAMLKHASPKVPLSESMALLEDFLNAYPQSEYTDQVYDALIDAYLTSKNYPAALASIDKIQQPNAKILGTKQQLLYYLGTEELISNRYSAAIGYFNQAVEVGEYADKTASIFWRGESYYREGNFKMAASDFLSIVNTVSAANYGLGYCSFKQKDYTQAENYFKAYIAQGGADRITLADAYARLGDCYLDKRRLAEAEAAYSQAGRLAPDAADYTLFQKGYVLGLQKNYKGKIALMDELMRNSPQSPYLPNALYEKGRAQVMLDNSKAAIATYQSLLKGYPNTDEARKAGLEIGLLYYNAGDTQHAAAAYKQVIAGYPDSDEAQVALQDLKSVYFDANDVAAYAEYVRSLGKGAMFDATEQDKLTYLAAERFVSEKKPEKAQEALANYLQAFPDGFHKSEAYHYLATLYFNKQQYIEAKSTVEQFIEQESPSTYWLAKSFILLSDIYVAEGDLTQARQYLESLQTNYTNADDDILQLVDDRLEKLKE